MRINNPKLLLRKKTQKDPQGRGSKQFKERLRGRIKIMRPRRPLASQESGDQQLKRIFLKKKTTNEQFPTQEEEPLPIIPCGEGEMSEGELSEGEPTNDTNEKGFQEEKTDNEEMIEVSSNSEKHQ